MDHSWDERDVITKLTRQLGPKYLGDDAAVLNPDKDPIAVCADALVQDVHFDLKWSSLTQIGAKALVVNLSDLAASGAVPWVFLSTISCPPTLAIDEIFGGLRKAADNYDITLVGGDVTASATLVISVTALGSCRWGRLSRRGAKPGDTLMCTGPLGASAHGLALLSSGCPPDLTDPFIRAHLEPSPRLKEGVAALRAGASAALDISDGLALDLHRLADASNVGFELHNLPRFMNATDQEVLAGGEDFELVFTTPDPEGLTRVFCDQGLTPPLAIGTILEDPMQRRLGNQTLAPLGYLH